MRLVNDCTQVVRWVRDAYVHGLAHSLRRPCDIAGIGRGVMAGIPAIRKSRI